MRKNEFIYLKYLQKIWWWWSECADDVQKIIILSEMFDGFLNHFSLVSWYRDFDNPISNLWSVTGTTCLMIFPSLFKCLDTVCFLQQFSRVFESPSISYSFLYILDNALSQTKKPPPPQQYDISLFYLTWQGKLMVKFPQKDWRDLKE